MQDEPLIEAADGCPRARVGQHQMRPDDRLGERLLKHVLLEGHVVDVGLPRLVDAVAAFQEKPISRVLVVGLGFDLDEVEAGTILDQDVCPEEAIAVLDCRLEQGHAIPLEQFSRTGQGDLLVQFHHEDAARKIAPGQRAHLNAALGQRLHEIIIHGIVGVLGLSDVEQFSRARQGADEQALG